VTRCHPSTLTLLLDELGLGEKFDAVPHSGRVPYRRRRHD